MTNKSTEASEVSKRLKALVDYICACQVRVSKGEIMDLQGLDKNVIGVCDAIGQLPEKEGQAMEEQLSSLIDSLEVLARTMREQQEKYAAGGK